MPTKNPRIFVTLEPALHKWLKKSADRSGISISGIIRDIVKDAHREHEDAYWAAEGEKRLSTFDRKKAVSNKKTWDIKP